MPKTARLALQGVQNDEVVIEFESHDEAWQWAKAQTELPVRVVILPLRPWTTHRMT